jgi:hypothetical protein
MASLDDIFDVFTDPVKFNIKRPLKNTESFLKGDFSEAWEGIKSTPGDHNRMMSNNLIDAGMSENNKLVQNPDATAAAVVAMIYGGGAMMGGEGGAGGGAGGGGGTGGGGIDWPGMWDKGKDLYNTGKEYKGYYDKAKGFMESSSGGSKSTQSQVRSESRASEYSGLIGRISGSTNNEINPYDEIITPTGARY